MSRKRNNIPGAAEQPLRAVKNQARPGQYAVSSKSKDASAYNDIIKAVTAEIRASQVDSGNYSREILSKSIDNTLDRIVFELDKREDAASFTAEQIDQIKLQILGALSEQNLSDKAITAIKDGIKDIIDVDDKEPDQQESNKVALVGKEVKSVDDETAVSDFDILQKFVDEQFQTLNESIKSIPGTTFGGISKMFTAGIGRIQHGMTLLSKNVTGFAKNTVTRISSFTKFISDGAVGGIRKVVDGISKGIGSVIKGIGGLGTKFKTSIAGVISGMGQKMGGFFSKLNPFKNKSVKEKKAEKKRDSIFDSLDKLVKRLKKFADNTKAAVLAFIDSIIIPAAKIISKGLSIILKPLMTFILGAIWGSGIGIFLVGIGIGIGLISLAVKKLVDWVVDDIGPEIERWLSVCTPETVNNVMNAAANFINTFSALMTGLFAPIIAIGTLIMSAIEPVSEFVKELLTSVKNHLMPVVDKLLGFIERTVIRILEAIEPIINKIIDVVSGTVLHILEAIDPIIHSIIDIISGTVLSILNAIKPIVEAMEPLLKIVSDVICGVIKLTVMAIQAAIKGITDWWEDVKKEGGLWPWFKKRLVEWWDKVCNIARSIRDAIVNWWNSPDNPIKALFDKLADMIWSLPVIGTFRPFGFLAGKDFFLSEAEEEEYKEITSKREEAQDLQKEIDKLQKYIDTKDYKGGDGTASFGRTKEEMERDMAALRAKQTKLNAEANAAAAEKMKQSQDIAVQQVGPAMQQLNNMESMQVNSGVELSKEAALYSNEAAQKQAQQAEDSMQQAGKIDSILDIVQNIQLTQAQPAFAPDDIAAAAAAGGVAGGMAGKSRGLMLENR